MWFLNSSKNLNVAKVLLLILFGRCGGLIISTLYSEPNALGLSPGNGHRVVFLGKVIHSQSTSPHPGVYTVFTQLIKIIFVVN